MTASYVHGQGIDEPIKGLSAQGTVPEWYYTFDGLGSVVDLTDSVGAIVEQYKYDSFGKLETPPATGNPYTYTSREYDSESGLYYYRARYYDAGVGRFITADPVNFDEGVNFYIYVQNNSINFTDPEGLYTIDASCNDSLFNKQQIEQALRDLENKLKSGKCIKGDYLRNNLRDKLKKVRVKCNKKINYCGQARPWFGFGKVVEIGPDAMNPDSCGPVGSTILHEMVHTAQRWPNEKVPEACEDACYGYDPDSNSCPSECK